MTSRAGDRPAEPCWHNTLVGSCFHGNPCHLMGDAVHYARSSSSLEQSGACNLCGNAQRQDRYHHYQASAGDKRPEIAAGADPSGGGRLSDRSI